MTPKNRQPPDWPLADLIAVARTTLIDHGTWGDRRPYPPPAPNGPSSSDPPSLGAEDEARIYPFTKGLDLTNDGIGYGEETEVTVLASDGRTTVIQRRRRTRTGSIVVAPAPTPAPSDAVRSPSRPISKPPPPETTADGPASAGAPEKASLRMRIP